MYIIDKNKDFYDHIVGEYGLDKTVCFDRRGSVKVTQDLLIHKFGYDCNICCSGDYCDKARLEKTCNELIKRNGNRGIYGIVEAGYFQYLIRVFDIEYTIETNNSDFKNKRPYIRPVYNGKLGLIHVYDDRKHYNSSPISLYGVSNPFGYWLDKSDKHNFIYANDIRVTRDTIVENPVLIDTKVPSILDAHTIYTNIFDYISSKSDFEIIDTRSDVAKAVDHGFDKKTSFRNM